MKRSRISPKNSERRAAKHEKAFGPKADWIRAQPCLVPGCWRWAEAAHAIARGMGSAKGDLRHLVNLCRGHHMEAGEYRTSQRSAFERRHGLDRGQPGEGLVRIAEETHARWKDGEDYGAPW